MPGNLGNETWIIDNNGGHVTVKPPQLWLSQLVVSARHYDVTSHADMRRYTLLWTCTVTTLDLDETGLQEETGNVLKIGISRTSFLEDTWGERWP